MTQGRAALVRGALPPWPSDCPLALGPPSSQRRSDQQPQQQAPGHQQGRQRALSRKTSFADAHARPKHARTPHHGTPATSSSRPSGGPAQPAAAAGAAPRPARRHRDAFSARILVWNAIPTAGGSASVASLCRPGRPAPRNDHRANAKAQGLEKEVPGATAPRATTTATGRPCLQIRHANTTHHHQVTRSNISRSKHKTANLPKKHPRC